ncbi:hypothetical protein KI387_035339 [Taxus chinensis]|uniref:Uncharacterized protein n=1 Tax=Taxus chinensis TaxID=29808 RepID=A0AA38KJ47_TAXCH|nr:hypothetical protein KI387_035339 [Taxus chinensis]
MAARYRRFAPPAESASDSDDDLGQQSQPIQLPKRKEARGWISEAEWTITIEQNSDVDRLRPPSVVSIFRVPNFLKQSKQLRGGEAAYVPQIISLGPYHHTNPPLPPMDNHKGRALRRVMTRFNINLSNDPNNTDFSSRAKDEILLVEDKIRNTYEEKIDCDGESLALMLSLDGCFILEILRTLGGEKFPVADASSFYEPLFERNRIDYTGFDILNDILMLENQVPLIVLRKILELELNSADNVEKKLFNVLVKSPRSKFYPFRYDMREWSWPPLTAEQSQHLHLLGLLHTLIVSPPCSDAAQTDPNAPDRAWNPVIRIPRAVELTNAGIKFKPCDGGIKKIKFDEKTATIHLPPINITDYTEVLFRNLIALEVCKPTVVQVTDSKPSVVNYVTCYLSLMDELIDSEEDVAVLRKSDIITNYLGSEAEVAELLNGLCSGVTMSRRDLFAETLKRPVNEHYRSKFKVWSAEFVKEHFSSPWRSLALAGAILALLLTVVQTIFSIFSVYKP